MTEHAAVLRLAASTLARTWNLTVSGEQHVERMRAAGSPILFAVWHGNLLAPLWHRRGEGITLLVSAHDDGGQLAAAARGWGYDAVRGSSTRGGVQGLRGLVRVLRRGGVAAVTPDGPRGPARIPKPGVAAAAQLTGAPVVPVATAASRGWRLHSWDRFLVPRPFARVAIAYGDPLIIKTNAGDPSTAAASLARAMGALAEEARSLC